MFAALIAPGPGWNAAYGRYFRAGCAALFAGDHGGTIVRFRQARSPPRPEIDTEFVLANRAKIDREGRGPANVLGLDTRSVGWIPTALVLALTLATPLPWARRLRALILGLAAVHAYLALIVGVFLWNQSAGHVPVSWLPFWPALGNGLEETFVTQLWPSFAIPVLIWVLATFRREDLGGAIAES